MEEGILERVVFHAGKTFIHAGEAHTDAYIIQSGEVVAYVTENYEKIEIARYGRNAILAESNLLVDGKSELYYEAVMDTTAVKISRQDFEKKILRLDQTVHRIIQTLLQKMKSMEFDEIEHAKKTKQIDFKAREIVDFLLRNVQDTRKPSYEVLLLPHFNIMIKGIEALRLQERHDLQRSQLQQKLVGISASTDEDTIHPYAPRGVTREEVLA